jgi:hypothetical protein
MKSVTKAVSLSWIVNFAIYIAIAAWLGGDAINGYSEDERYFVAWHGQATEVSRAAFEYSRWHTYVLLAHFVAAFVLGLLEWRTTRRLSRIA